MNNSSIASADRTTHLKIVVVSLVAAIAVVAVGIAARPGLDEARLATPVIKAGKAVVFTSQDGSTIR